MFIRSIPLLLTLGLLTAAPAAAADAQAGKKLHDQHCVQCHDSGVYTREDRRINSLPGLTKQVRRCQLSQGLQWFDKDIQNVVQYLNQTYYHFE
ncbi:MAG TPA: cytochrome c [Thiohalobacter sp.]|nr:cytochrome c [Thiohalobacter sp.]